MTELAHLPISGRSGHDTAWALLAHMYRARFGTDLPAVARTDRGKPYFPDSPVYFSLSHTPHHAFCVLSDRPVGVDAEECSRPVRLRLADKILSPAEKRRFDAAADPAEALLRLWVLKEALVKCTGDGLRGYPNHTDFSPEDPRIQMLEGCFVAVIEQEEPNAL